MGTAQDDDSGMNVRYFDVPDALSDLFRHLVRLEVTIPDGQAISDLMIPLWGNLTWRDRATVRIGYRSGEIVNAGIAGLIGPHDHAVWAIVGPVRQWTAVLMPGAWARFIDAPARDYLNCTVQFTADPAFSVVQGFGETLFTSTHDSEEEFRRLTEFLLPLADIPRKPVEHRIDRIVAALTAAEVSTVGDLAEVVGVNRRTLERICDNVFGLPPKFLLRRQRFLRSVAVHMMNADRSWTHAIDESYYDQAQFVREFRKLMGVLPTEFARLKRPLSLPFLLENLGQWQRAVERSSSKA